MSLYSFRVVLCIGKSDVGISVCQQALTADDSANPTMLSQSVEVSDIIDGELKVGFKSILSLYYICYRQNEEHTLDNEFYELIKDQSIYSEPAWKHEEFGDTQQESVCFVVVNNYMLNVLSKQCMHPIHCSLQLGNF